MSTKASDFIVQITNYFHGHWEDTEWWKLAAHQILLGLAIRELACKIQDPEVKAQILAAADKSIAKHGQTMIRS